MAALDVEEYRRWYGQGEHTLASAERDASAADYGWACFKAQQAGEYMVKALLRAVGDPAVGHSLVKLLETLERRAGIPIPDDLQRLARTLDRHYIPPRYPDAYPSGMPYEFYDAPTADEAIRAAKRLAEFVREQARAMGIEHDDRPSGQGGAP